MPVAALLALALLAEPPPPSVGLPRWQDAPIVDPAAKPEPLRRPRDGGVALGFGIVSSIAGFGLLTGSILATQGVGVDDVGSLRTQHATGLGVSGGVLLAGGVAMVASGSARRGAYLRSDVGRAAPPTGRAMQSSALVLMILGGATAVIGGVIENQRCDFDWYADNYECDSPIVSASMLGVGVASFAVGLGLVVAGGGREAEWKSWARERAIQPGVRVARDAVQLGVSGRF